MINIAKPDSRNTPAVRSKNLSEVKIRRLSKINSPGPVKNADEPASAVDSVTESYTSSDVSLSSFKVDNSLRLALPGFLLRRLRVC